MINNLYGTDSLLKGSTSAAIFIYLSNFTEHKSLFSLLQGSIPSLFPGTGPISFLLQTFHVILTFGLTLKFKICLFRFPHQNVCISVLPQTCYLPRPSHVP